MNESVRQRHTRSWPELVVAKVEVGESGRRGESGAQRARARVGNAEGVPLERKLHEAEIESVLTEETSVV